MTQAEKLKKALSSFDEETLASTFSTEELSNIERLLGEPAALTQQRAVEDALGIPTAKAIPETEEMSKGHNIQKGSIG